MGIEYPLFLTVRFLEPVKNSRNPAFMVSNKRPPKACVLLKPTRAGYYLYSKLLNHPFIYETL